ncbi:hypothetical protein PV08_05601 [Exophiala spinifera]|uniref:Uncharacterized protein n=1 Tax=Exophiala spinifera TaxID=91928 RepID=A0A0D2B9F1_9EURO|nr:uncharacterized protein PV08_05601 [Exophiala spinifera]KIW15553.1 hypothetical protein PV08_05601 [Exophiala spinifera]
MSAGLSEAATLTHNTTRSRSRSWSKEASNRQNTSNGPTVRPKRSRRLQKRPSSNALTVSSTTGPIVPPAMVQQHPDESLTALPQLRTQAIPQRSSSLRKQRLQTAEGVRAISKPSTEQLGERPPSGDAQDADQEPAAAHDQKPPSPPTTSARDQSGPHQPPRTPRHVPLAPFDPSPLNPLYHIPSPKMSNLPFRPASSPSASSSSPPQTQPSTTPTVSSTPQTSSPHYNGHTILPPGFRPGSSTHQTDVETAWQPAVTREVVKEHTVEIVQEQVTREIHVHHYYTHIQPIRAVEVLPARHFIVDPATGQKVEIPAPEGWEMPSDMQPRKLNLPETNILEPMSRHYLVDEDHPEGTPEPPPRDFQRRSQLELNKIARASHTAKWSPFPKVD